MQIRDIFIPHEGNGYKPNFLQRASFLVMLSLVLLSFALANLQSVLWMTSDWMVSAVLPGVLVELTNEKRSDDRLWYLSKSDVLSEAANLKAAHMAEHEYFAHYSPDGISPWHWFNEVSYDFVHAGENLAVHFTESDEVVRAWMESPAHRANILSGNYTEIGIGTARGEYQGFPTVYVVQLFGTPVLADTPETTSGTVASVVETVTEPTDDVTSVAPATFETRSHEEATSSTGSEAVIEGSLAGTSPQEELVTEPVLYSDLATSTQLIATGASQPTNIAPIKESTPYERIFTKSALVPSFWLQTFYAALASLVVIALIFSIVIEWRKQHPVQIAYGGGLLAAMAILFYIHTTLSSGAVIV